VLGQVRLVWFGLREVRFGQIRFVCVCVHVCVCRISRLAGTGLKECSTNFMLFL